MSFRFRERVKVKRGLYAGMVGRIQTRGLFGLEYGVAFFDEVDDLMHFGFFWFWNLEKK